MKRSTPDRLPIRSGSPLSDNHSRSEGNKVPDGEQQRELPFVVTGPGTGAKPRAVTQVNRISVDRRASLETGEGGSVGGDSLGIRGSLAPPERQEMGSDGGPTGVRADGTRRNIHSGTREARCGPGESRERAPITGDKPGSGERPHRESEQVIVPSASPRKITRGEGSACTSGHAFEAEGTSGTAGKAQCPRDPDKGLDRVRVLQRKLYRAAKADSRRTFGVLYDKVSRRDVLEEAWKRVKAAGGGAGADGQTLNHIENEGVESFLDGIEAELRAKSYRPEVIVRKYIPKAGKPGQYRPLGVPIIRDRVVQTAVKLVIEPIFEADFLPCSYGFRPKRSAHDAMRSITQVMRREGKRWVCDLDLKACFDSIAFEPLMEAVGRRIRDKWVLRLIRRWLKAGILEHGVVTEPSMGTPQGAVLSPLLANIYLHHLDQRWTPGGAQDGGWQDRAHLVRYADDMVLLSHTRQQAEETLQEVRQCLEQHGLKLNEGKSRLVHAQDGFDFLGFHVRWAKSVRTGRMFALWRPRRSAVQRVKARLKARAKSVPLNGDARELIQVMNLTLKGWSGYFRYSHATLDFIKVDRFARTQVRIWLCRKHHHRSRNLHRYPGRFIHSTLGLHCLVRDVRSGVRRPNAARRNARRRAVCGKTARTVR